MKTLLVVAAVLCLTSCSRTTDPERWTLEIRQIESPARGNSSEPHLAVSERGGTLLSWIEREGKNTVLKFAERTGTGWTQPATAASGSNWFLSYADVPSVMRRADGSLVAQWLVSTEAMFEGYDLHLSYSKDNGRTWAPSFTPHHDGTTFQHGFASLLELPGNGLGVAWLDGRNSEFFENDPASGTMTLRYAAFDANWKQVADSEIDHNVCECCQTAAGMSDDGPVVAYRNRSDKEIRDIAVSRLQNGKWTPEAIVHNDNWEIYACPVNGPGLAISGQQAATAWFTVKNDLGQAYAAFSNDGGRTWGTPIRLDDAGSLGRVDVELLDDGTAVASWVEFRKEGSQFRVRLITPSGERSAPVTIAAVDGGRAAGFPRMARQGGDLIFAWSTSAGESDPTVLRVLTATARLP